MSNTDENELLVKACCCEARFPVRKEEGWHKHDCCCVTKLYVSSLLSEMTASVLKYERIDLGIRISDRIYVSLYVPQVKAVLLLIFDVLTMPNIDEDLIHDDSMTLISGCLIIHAMELGDDMTSYHPRRFP